VEEVFDDLPEWRQVLHDARQRWVAADPDRRFADAMFGKFDQPLKNLGQSINEVARSVQRLAPPTREDDVDA
jgi:hypothetical protein